MPWREDRRTRFWAFSTRQFVLVIAVLAVAGVALGMLSVRIHHELVDLTAAPTDNQQWEMAQIDVEALVLIDAMKSVELGLGASLEEVRLRFDIFYSRIEAVETRAGARSSPDLAGSVAALDRIRAGLDQLVPLIDGPDDALQAALPEMRETVSAMRATARAVALDYVRHFAQASDTERQALAELIARTATMGAALLVALSLAIIVLIRVFQLSVARSRVILESNERFQNTIFASRDAIILADEQGRVLEVNPAAEGMFGYSHAAFLGARISDLIVPERLRRSHTASFRRHMATGGLPAGEGERLVTTARRADGEEFPVEISLGAAVHGEHRIVIGFVRDISAQRQAEQELIAARDVALAAARARSSLLAFMSHEMRTPLNGVLAILDLLRGTALDDRQRGYVETATRSGEILLHLIADALDVTRLQSDALTLREAPFDLAALLDEVAAINRPAAGARGTALVMDLHLPALNVLGDRNRLRQIIINLVGNAIKFTRDGTIRLTAAATQIDDDLACFDIAVEDSGIGIAPDQIERIFEEFVTIDAPGDPVSRGTGLGLAIARRIATLMGGTLSATSTPGRGSRFVRSVPMHTLSGPLPVPAAGPAEDRVPWPRPGARVLVVEDNPTNRLVIGEILARFGCRIREAEDGVEGVALARAERFDLILMDVSMPRLDGPGATRAIRSDATGMCREVPIIGLTAHALPDTEADLLAAGMQRCLYKPVRVADLRALLVDIVGAAPPDTGPDDAPPEIPEAPPPTPAPEDDAPDDAAEVLDTETLAELAEMLGEDRLRSRLEAFADELAGLGAALARARDEGDGMAAGKLAHRTAGSAAVFGARALRTALIAVETAGVRGDPAALDRALAALMPEISACQTALAELAADMDAAD